MECFINKIKHYRRIFSRFEKLDTRYLGFPHFTAALIWLRLKCQHNLVLQRHIWDGTLAAGPFPS